jgi:prepilin-type N-terminal cleavage/methylation domain-containing protein
MRNSSREAGFSLLELIVAMAITLIISGAIYGLMTGGQNAFRREPELSERQQNIRVAMDLIMRDIQNAGVGMPDFIQTFTRNLDACSGCPDGGSPMGSAGQIADELEIVTNNSYRKNEPGCSDFASAGLARTVRAGVAFTENVPVMVIFQDGTWGLFNVVGTGTNKTGAGNCDANEEHVQLSFNSGTDTSGMNMPGGICQPNGFGIGNAGTSVACTDKTAPPEVQATCCMVQEIGFAQVVRYRIRVDTSDCEIAPNAAGTPVQVCTPVLERSATDSWATGFQTVARGIEDLQVRYTQASGAVVDGAPQVVPLDYSTLVTQVQVTLSSRSVAYRIEGLTAPAPAAAAAGVPNAIRGSLTSVGTPRHALAVVANQSAVPSPAPSAPLWQ